MLLTFVFTLTPPSTTLTLPSDDDDAADDAGLSDLLYGDVTYLSIMSSVQLKVYHSE